jgi:hypothetical protein
VIRTESDIAVKIVCRKKVIENQVALPMHFPEKGLVRILLMIDDLEEMDILVIVQISVLIEKVRRTETQVDV